MVRPHTRHAPRGLCLALVPALFFHRRVLRENRSACIRRCVSVAAQGALLPPQRGAPCCRPALRVRVWKELVPGVPGCPLRAVMLLPRSRWLLRWLRRVHVCRDSDPAFGLCAGVQANSPGLLWHSSCYRDCAARRAVGCRWRAKWQTTRDCLPAGRSARRLH
jgi:hypothetical protein